MKTNELKNKKITLATLKSFVKKAPKLYVETLSSFSGMTDSVETFHETKLVEVSKDRALGIHGVWTVGGSRDYFKFVENETMFGIEVYNSCGCGILWTVK
jgi:phosphoserine aminotransferase